jgi:hypothetical protein
MPWNRQISAWNASDQLTDLAVRQATVFLPVQWHSPHTQRRPAQFPVRGHLQASETLPATSDRAAAHTPSRPVDERTMLGAKAVQR